MLQLLAQQGELDACWRMNAWQIFNLMLSGVCSDMSLPDFPAGLMCCFYMLATYLSTPAGPDQLLTSMLVLLISLMCSRSAVKQKNLQFSLLLGLLVDMCSQQQLQLPTLKFLCVACLRAVRHAPDCIKLQHVTRVGTEHPAVLVRL
jgi:hypothetical protein